MTKRILSLLTVITILMVLFPSCKAAEKDGASKAGTSKTGKSSSAHDTSDAINVEEPADSTGVSSKQGSVSSAKKSNTASAVNSKIPLKEPVTFTFFLQEHSSQPVKLDSMKWDVITRMTNVTLDVDIATGSTATNKLMAASASGKMYDITCLQYVHLRNLKESLFMDVTDLIKTETPHYYELVKNDPTLNLFRINGKYRGFNMYVNAAVDTPFETSPMTIAVRKDVLDDINRRVPATWQEWFDVMKALKKKYPNSTPYSGRAVSNILEYWTQSLSGYRFGIDYVSREGKYVAGVLKDNFRSVLQFMKDCYDEGILDRDFDKVSSSTFLDGAVNSKTFFWIDNGVNMYTQNNALQKVNKNAEFVQMNLMKSHLNNNRKSGLAYTQTTNYVNMYCLSSQTEHKEELLAFIDWCYSDEGMLANCLGEKGVSYELNSDGTPYVPKKIWSKYIGNAMPEYAWMSDLGLGQLCFAPRVLGTGGIEWKGREVDEDALDKEFEAGFQADLKAGCYETAVTITPDIDSTMQSRYATLQKYMGNQIVKFIKGTRAMSEYNTFLNELNNMGLKDLVDACNKAK